MAVRSFMGSRYTRASQPGSAQALQGSFAQGMAEILSNLSEFVENQKANAGPILVDALEETFGKALVYCPEDSGDLRASAYLEAETFRNKSVAAIGFGKGGRPDYAIYVHEMPYEHEAPTRWKFLEAALDEDYYAILNKVPALIKARSGV